MNPNWQKMNGLLPVIVQHAVTNQVLMLGYMNEEAFEKTKATHIVTFFSRSKNRLWVKGETSGHSLKLVSLMLDCDSDSFLCKALPLGPTCHTGDVTCFHADKPDPVSFLNTLSALISDRYANRPQNSYTTSLFEQGKARIAQKIGEEGVELALAKMKEDADEIINESADLIFHMLVLLQHSNLSFNAVCQRLKERHNA